MDCIYEFNLIVPSDTSMNFFKDPLIWVCFTNQGVIQYGYVLRFLTHTSGHFYAGVAPPPPPCSLSYSIILF